jgi:hypothetical protein
MSGANLPEGRSIRIIDEAISLLRMTGSQTAEAA